MKIAILTHYHESTNYGGNLQAYALCRFINKLGREAYQIQISPWLPNQAPPSFTERVKAALHKSPIKLLKALLVKIKEKIYIYIYIYI